MVSSPHVYRGGRVCESRNQENTSEGWPRAPCLLTRTPRISVPGVIKNLDWHLIFSHLERGGYPIGQQENPAGICMQGSKGWNLSVPKPFPTVMFSERQKRFGFGL